MSLQIPLIKLLLATSLIFQCSLLRAQCTCNPSTAKDRQERSVAKHETNFTGFSRRKDTVSVSTMAAWDKKYHSITDTLKDRPSTVRVKKSPEDTMYVLKGYLWFVKAEKNDCDYHMEIGNKNLFSTRIIVEAPEENCGLQQKIDAKMNQLKLKKNKHFKKGIPVLVKGLGFYDASHRSDGKHGDVHTNAHIWELHPVVDIEFTE